MGGNYLNMVFREIYKHKNVESVSIEADYSTLDENTLSILKSLVQKEMQCVSDNEKEYIKHGQYRAAADSRYEYNGLYTALNLIETVMKKMKTI